MKRGPAPGSRQVDFVAKTKSAWGADIPPEILVLAEACSQTSGSAVARQLGYSPAVVSHMISNKYPGDVGAVLIRIRGALMGEEVSCPVLGQIGKDICDKQQKLPFSSANPQRVQLHRACPRCPNNRSASDFRTDAANEDRRHD